MYPSKCCYSAYFGIFGPILVYFSGQQANFKTIRFCRIVKSMISLLLAKYAPRRANFLGKILLV